MSDEEEQERKIVVRAEEDGWPQGRMPEPEVSGPERGGARPGDEGIVEGETGVEREILARAEEALRRVKERGLRFLAEERDLAAEELEGLSDALEQAARALRARGSPEAADWAAILGARFQEAARHVGRSEPSGILCDLVSLARRRPGAFIGALCAAAGAAWLFLSSSTPEESPPEHGG